MDFKQLSKQLQNLGRKTKKRTYKSPVCPECGAHAIVKDVEHRRHWIYRLHKCSNGHYFPTKTHEEDDNS